MPKSADESLYPHPLIPIEDLSALIPNVFVALDVSTGPYTENQRLVGVVDEVKFGSLLLKLSEGDFVEVAHNDIQKAYFAPMGYRP